MLSAIQKILGNALERLSLFANEYLPSLLAGLVILLSAYLLALLFRGLLNRLFKGLTLDRFLRRSGVAGLFPQSEKIRSVRLFAQIIYWCILLIGFMTALSIFETPLTRRMFESLMIFFPSVVAAMVIVLAGIWLGHYLGRNMLVWAVNEEFHNPRRLALLVKMMVIFTAVTIASDVINFARVVVLSAYMMVVGGAVVALTLALGLGGRDAARRYLLKKCSPDSSERMESGEEESALNHL
jgi:hypothetical protein